MSSSLFGPPGPGGVRQPISEADRRAAALRARHERIAQAEALRAERMAAEQEHLDDLAGRWLTVKEIAVMFRVSKMTIYRMVNEDILTSVRVGRSIRVERTAVVQYLNDISQDDLQ